MLSLEEYMELPYITLVQELGEGEERYFYGRILELDGCQSTGSTMEELYRSLREAMEGYISTKLEAGLPVPVPRRTEEYSGKFMVRIPKSLHRKLAEEAIREGVSLNALVACKLSM